jgi:predicted nucleic acid-binding protein
LAPVAVYDACVLYPAALRDFLLRLAEVDVVQPRWSARILDECFRSILRERPDLSDAALARTRAAMGRAFPDASVTGHEPLIDSLALPDPDDRHVLAAAIHAGATVIVTFNLRDFPSETLSALGVRALHPDDFVLERIEAAPGLACIALQDQLASLSRPPVTRPELLSRLASQGLPRSAARLADLLVAGG